MGKEKAAVEEAGKKNSWIKLIVFIVIVGALFYLLRRFHVDFSHLDSEQFRARVDAFGIWGPLAYILFYFFRPLILLPAGITSACAGVIWGPLKGFIILQIAANISAVGEFFIARYFARGAVEKMLKGRIAKIDAAVKRRGFISVLLIRIIPNVAWDIQNLSLGLTKVSFRDYFWGTLIGIIPGSFALVYFGGALIKVLSNPKNLWQMVLAAVLLAGVYYLQKFLRRRKSNS